MVIIDDRQVTMRVEATKSSAGAVRTQQKELDETIKSLSTQHEAEMEARDKVNPEPKTRRASVYGLLVSAQGRLGGASRPLPTWVAEESSGLYVTRSLAGRSAAWVGWSRI